MLLDYHVQLLNDSLKANYFNGLDKYTYITYQLLIDGLKYPDVPCNDLIITDSTKQIKYLNYNICKLPLPLLYLFDEEKYGLKQVVQSHRGLQAIGHAMTYEPSASMLKVRQKILRRIEILYMLALNDDTLIKECENNKGCSVCHENNGRKYECLKAEPNIFWMGQILHCIQDSYSRAHTLRMLPGTPIKSVNSKKTNHHSSKSPYTQKEESYAAFKLIKDISKMIEMPDFSIARLKSGSKKDIQKFLQKNMKGKKARELITNNSNDIVHIFKLTLFFKFQRFKMHELFPSKNIPLSFENFPSEKEKHNNISNLKDYPYIISFRYLEHQKRCGHLFHMRYDTQMANKRFEYYIIQNCQDVLNLYKQHIKDKNKSICAKISEMIKYIAQNVFPILPKYHHNPSATLCEHHPCECELAYDKVYDYAETS